MVDQSKSDAVFPVGRRRETTDKPKTLLPEKTEGIPTNDSSDKSHTPAFASRSIAADDTKTRLITAAKYVPTLAYLLLCHTWIWNLFVIFITTGAVYEYRIIVGHVWPRPTLKPNPSQNGNASSSTKTQIEQHVLPCPSLTVLTLSDHTMFATAGLLAASATFGNLVVFHAVASAGIAMLLVSHFLDGSLTGRVEMERMCELSLRVMGSVYVAWPLSHAALIASIPKYGPGFMFAALYCSWFGDGAAYFIGKKIGKTPLFPAISPKKSTEGFIANIFVSCVPLVVLYVLRENGIWIDLLPPQMYLVDYIGLGLLLGILGPMGDLLESYIKRAANVKDSGDFFPGHGGMLDRFDSFLLALPVYYYFVRLVYV